MNAALRQLIKLVQLRFGRTVCPASQAVRPTSRLTPNTAAAATSRASLVSYTRTVAAAQCYVLQTSRKTFMLSPRSQSSSLLQCRHAGMPCIRGICVCPQEKPVKCGTPAMCTNTNTDANNCGACGKKCSANAGCTKGNCMCLPGVCCV